MYYWTLEVAAMWKSAFGQIKDGGQLPNFKRLNSYNSAADCSISFKFGTEFHRTPADVL